MQSTIGDITSDPGDETTKKKTSKRKVGRKRRNKRDVVLDFTKRVKAPGEDEKLFATTTLANLQKSRSKPSNNESTETKRKSAGQKLKLRTSGDGYAKDCGLPEQVEQREYESVGQFFRRIDRMVAKARVEASLEARFDMTLAKGRQPQQVAPDNLTQAANANTAVAQSKPNTDHKISRIHHNKRKKRLKR